MCKITRLIKLEEIFQLPTSLPKSAKKEGAAPRAISRREISRREISKTKHQRCQIWVEKFEANTIREIWDIGTHRKENFEPLFDIMVVGDGQTGILNTS